ncbi:MAG: amidohydrolase [Acidobacteriota bacterium]
MKLNRCGLILLAFCCACAGNGPQQAADRIFLNADIWTGDAARPQAEAMAVSADRLLAVGSNDEIGKHRGPATVVTDLKRSFVAPGFIDAHTHFLALERIELDEAADVAEIQDRIRRFKEQHPDSPWLTGRGWTYTMFPSSLPHWKYLDEVEPELPVFVRDRDGHAGLANSRALAAAGVDRSTPDPPGGAIERDAAGDATGVLKEKAMGLVSRLIPEAGEEEIYRTLKKRMDQAASYGLTSIHNASSINLPVYERVTAEGGLKVRVYASVPFVTEPSADTLSRYRALRERHRGPQIKYGAVKGMLDGTIDSRTAVVFEPYVGGGTGILMWNEEDLDRAVALYDREGFQVLLHAIGDRAVHVALNAYEKAARSNGTSGRRHRIEHIELPQLSDLPRFRQLGVIASTQAIFANPDQATLGNYAVLLGRERASRSNAFRLFDDAGAVQAFGSDWPVSTMEVLRGMYAAVSRTTPEGTPPGGWYPENRISADAALRHYTRDAAYASFDEEIKGTLTPGKLADFVVLSEDILEPPSERILSAKVLMCVMGGKETFRSPGF